MSLVSSPCSSESKTKLQIAQAETTRLEGTVSACSLVATATVSLCCVLGGKVKRTSWSLQESNGRNGVCVSIGVGFSLCVALQLSCFLGYSLNRNSERMNY